MTASTKPDTRMHGQAVDDPVIPSQPQAGPTPTPPLSARERLARIAAQLLPSRLAPTSSGTTTTPTTQEFDYVIVGGGTAGAVLADRLTEDAGMSVAVIEGGPNDQGDERVLDLRRWMELLGSELDYGYATTEQPMGNSHIKHSRARVLGGCSGHNTLISFRPLREDLDGWAQHHGCPSWSAAQIQPFGDRLKLNTIPVAPQHRNHVVRDWVQAAHRATGAPLIDEGMNAHMAHRSAAEPFQSGVGFFDVSYDPYSGGRSSASVAYLHPIMPGGPRVRRNLHLFLETWASRLVFDSSEDAKQPGEKPLHATGVYVTDRHGHSFTLRAKREVILCAGAIDTPRLLLLSGIGPRAELERLGIRCVADVPGVGENLQDHPEAIIMWETRETPAETVMSSDAGLFLRILPRRGEVGSEEVPTEPTPHPGPDLMFHIYQTVWAEHTARLGFDVPEHAICMTPNIPRSQGRGKLSLASANPQDKPLLDFRYFEDADGYDAHVLVEGIKIARKIAQQPEFARHLVREIAPGPAIQSDAALSAYARSVAHTVYHPCATCKMGTLSRDALAVCDERDLRVRGTGNVRVVDASVFPVVPTVNPMLTVLQVAEAAAERIRSEVWAARWARQDQDRDRDREGEEERQQQHGAGQRPTTGRQARPEPAQAQVQQQQGRASTSSSSSRTTAGETLQLQAQAQTAPQLQRRDSDKRQRQQRQQQQQQQLAGVLLMPKK
ncbi:hypothetical protein OC835_003083 [Tilletia horrida]|nr:hypothetical protein OC835_003083 [Tilletia horrida]